jgi:hyperosmotically inducible periplasmic protein
VVSVLSDTRTRQPLIVGAARCSYRWGTPPRWRHDVKESDMQTHRQPAFRLRPIAALAAALAVTALAACDKPAEPRTVGEQVDSAMARAEQKGSEIAGDVKSAANKAAQSTEKAAGDVGDKVKDAAITTAVNAKLSQDSKLSVLRINVDTVNGHVALRGTAPDAASRDRAQQLASSVDGVVSVDNQLVVSNKG